MLFATPFCVLFDSLVLVLLLLSKEWSVLPELLLEPTLVVLPEMTVDVVLLEVLPELVLLFELLLSVLPETMAVLPELVLLVVLVVVLVVVLLLPLLLLEPTFKVLPVTVLPLLMLTVFLWMSTVALSELNEPVVLKLLV